MFSAPRRSARSAIACAHIQLRYAAPSNIPGPRTMNTILSTLPAVHLTRPDVGGSTGLIAGPTTMYGTGPTPPTLEGVVIANVNPYGLTLDYGSFQEIAVTTAAHAVDLETAGTRFQFVAKSGGNQYMVPSTPTTRIDTGRR